MMFHPNFHTSHGDSTLEETLYYATDANMNVTALLNSTGSCLARWTYDSYDQPTRTYGSSDYSNEILFAGYRYDSETGLYHVRHRAYHPGLGRWLNQDPIGELGGINLYAYVLNDPLNLIDPYGLWSLSRFIYTGDGNACDEVYDAAVQAAGDYVYEDGGIRGGYVSVGWSGDYGNLDLAAGATASWDIDEGASVSGDIGVGLGEVGRNSKGQFTGRTKTFGLAGTYQAWNQSNGFQTPRQGLNFTGIYSGTISSKRGGVYGGIGSTKNVGLGINYGPVAVGISVDPTRVIKNFRDSFNVLFH